jgi:galactosamine-6-phosphate isomerase
VHIKEFKNSNELAVSAAGLIIELISKKPDLLLCAATGNSPTQTYGIFVQRSKEYDASILRIVKLDEWGGIGMNDLQSCEQYLQQHLIKPLNISQDRYFGFLSNPENPSEETTRIQKNLDKEGPIDLCILGLGMNGHIAFNEPAEYLQPHCHIAKLSRKSLQHPMASQMDTKPTYGLTLGMADIMKSKTIIMLIQGINKKAITKEFLSKKVSTQLPASFLWLHPNVSCFIDKESI